MYYAVLNYWIYKELKKKNIYILLKLRIIRIKRVQYSLENIL